MDENKDLQIQQGVKNTPSKEQGGAEQLPQIPYEQIARQLSTQSFFSSFGKPRIPEEIITPMSFYKEDDKITLAGKVIPGAYRELISRPNESPKTSEKTQKTIDISRAGLKDFANALDEQDRQRQVEGKSPFASATTIKPGTDGFHAGGKTYQRTFMYYFDKSQDHWKNPHEAVTRAYLTLSIDQISKIQRHFVDLATQMYDAGIDFNAKAASAIGMEERTDNMVFYISASDQTKASELMKKFLSEKDIGRGHVLAAQPSQQEGLSWGFETNVIQNKIWQEVSGSSERASFNSFVAAMTMPIYLERFAEVHDKSGNTEIANTLREESRRVKAVIDKYQHPT